MIDQAGSELSSPDAGGPELGGDLRADADLGELSLALLTALQGGSLMSRTLRDTAPLRASMNAALAYLHSFAPELRDPA